MKTKKQRIKSLTWKYFFQQKIKEIIVSLLIILALILVPYFLGNYIGNNMSALCNLDWTSERVVECSIIFLWAEGMIYVMGIVLIISFISLLFWWIDSGWSNSKIKAKEVFR